MQPTTHHFEDDGTFPNSRLPVLVYASAFKPEPDLIEKELASHRWSNSWRNGVYSFHHYHSISHEVLVVCAGQAQLQLGGPKIGRLLELGPGDALVIPAGVAHRCVRSSSDFAVIGAYPEGRDWDLLRGEPGERPAADERIARVPLPEQDPVRGADGPMIQVWK